MSADANKALFRRFMEEVANQGHLAAVDELMAPDFTEHEAMPPGTPPGREGVKQAFAMVRAALPDLRVAIDDEIAEGDRVVFRETWRGTHRGELLGTAPTGKAVEFGVIDIVRVAGGKIVDHWAQTDWLSLLQQIGALPPPGQPAGSTSAG
jgi:predicted ester cyclase